MREKIYTIPLNDAFDADSECPFCYLQNKLENERVAYTLGASMMEPDSRMETNEKGFCNRHLHMMSNSQNALSLALVLDTHLNEIVKKLSALGSAVDDLKIEKNGFFKKSPELADVSSKLSSATDKILKTCSVCDAIDSTLKRYIETFFFLYHTESDFKKKFIDCKGFCLIHFSELTHLCTDNLSKEECIQFLKVIYCKQMENLKRVNDEVNYFTKKFDYRNKDLDWKNSKDAPIRCVEKLVGK